MTALFLNLLKSSLAFLLFSFLMPNQYVSFKLILTWRFIDVAPIVTMSKKFL